MDADHDDSLVRRRPRRSTAGNRMAQALIEMELDEDIRKLEAAGPDEDYVAPEDEEDKFEDDFASTDEEADKVAPETVEASAQEEERQARKAKRKTIEKNTATAHARHKMTFNPQILETEGAGPSTAVETTSAEKKKRRVSMGQAVDAETGQVVSNAKRQSRRTHTVNSTTALVSRLKDAESKKNATPKKAKIKEPVLTQAELIARALDMEEGNISEHKNYLANEAEKRKRAHIVRTVVKGPLLRWVSKRETVTVMEDAPPPPPPTVPTGQSAYSYGYGHLYSGYSPAYPPAANVPYPGANYPTSQSTSTASPGPTNQFRSSFIADPRSATPSVTGAYTTPPAYIPPQVPPVQPQKIAKTVTQEANYVIHEIGQDEDAPVPQWKETMAAMFGDHVKWEDLRVYASKGRPLARPTQTCPITGLPAPYLDPRTKVPYANIEAYKTITKILNNQYVWSETLGCYIDESPDQSSSSGGRAMEVG